MEILFVLEAEVEILFVLEDTDCAWAFIVEELKLKLIAGLGADSSSSSLSSFSFCFFNESTKN